MSKAACKAAIDGNYLATTGGLASESEEIERVFNSRGGSAIVWKISELCAELGSMINAALAAPREDVQE